MPAAHGRIQTAPRGQYSVRCVQSIDKTEIKKFDNEKQKAEYLWIFLLDKRHSVNYCRC